MDTTRTYVLQGYPLMRIQPYNYHVSVPICLFVCLFRRGPWVSSHVWQQVGLLNPYVSQVAGRHFPRVLSLCIGRDIATTSLEAFGQRAC